MAYPSGEVQQTLLGHAQGQVYSVRFFEDRRTLVSGGADSTIRVWDTHAGVELFKLAGHTGIVFRVCCVPGATVAAGTLVSASADGTRVMGRCAP
jgi:WD40 repeat protein